MHTDTTRDTSPVVITAFIIAVVLAILAVYNYATGVHGGAIVSSIGAVVAALFGILTD